MSEMLRRPGQISAMLNTTTGEAVKTALKQAGNNVREFYFNLPRPVRVGSKGPDPCLASTLGGGSRSNRKLFRVRRLTVGSRRPVSPLACVVALPDKFFAPIPLVR
jgi:hypothetical protein